jgi:hypothetical protein
MLTVTSDVDHEDEKQDEHDKKPIEQSDKPRAGSKVPFINLSKFALILIEYAVAAEYLARGYTLSDDILRRAIDIDSKRLIRIFCSRKIMRFTFIQTNKESPNDSWSTSKSLIRRLENAPLGLIRLCPERCRRPPLL